MTPGVFLTAAVAMRKSDDEVAIYAPMALFEACRGDKAAYLQAEEFCWAINRSFTGTSGRWSDEVSKMLRCVSFAQSGGDV